MAAVIGERIITPLSIVYLVVKLRVVPPVLASKTKNDAKSAEFDDADDEFLAGRKDAEDMPKGASDGGWAHAPHWPTVCFPLLTGFRLPHIFCRLVSLVGG